MARHSTSSIIPTAGRVQHRRHGASSLDTGEHSVALGRWNTLSKALAESVSDVWERGREHGYGIAYGLLGDPGKELSAASKPWVICEGGCGGLSDELGGYRALWFFGGVFGWLVISREAGLIGEAARNGSVHGGCVWWGGTFSVLFWLRCAVGRRLGEQQYEGVRGYVCAAYRTHAGVVPGVEFALGVGVFL